jgi:transketolase
MAMPYPQVLHEIARANPAVYGVSIDCWWFISGLASEFPERAIEVGIAEQNGVGVAAGLALCGKVPFVHGMVPFITMRSFEQVRTDIGYQHLNVKIVGAYSGGLEQGPWGCTHHGVEDVALMRLVPGMTVVLPADAWETEQAVRAIAALDGPAYIQLRGGETTQGEGRSFQLGRASVLRPGSDVTIIACGALVGEAAKAAGMLGERGVSVRLLNMHTVKPLDRDAVLSAAVETRGLVTLEEHTTVGGLGGAVAEVLAERPSVPLRRLGLPDTFAKRTASRAELLETYGMTARHAAEAAAELLEGHNA